MAPWILAVRDRINNSNSSRARGSASSLSTTAWTTRRRISSSRLGSTKTRLVRLDRAARQARTSIASETRRPARGASTDRKSHPTCSRTAMAVWRCKTMAGPTSKATTSASYRTSIHITLSSRTWQAAPPTCRLGTATRRTISSAQMISRAWIVWYANSRT